MVTEGCQGEERDVKRGKGERPEVRRVGSRIGGGMPRNTKKTWNGKEVKGGSRIRQGERKMVASAMLSKVSRLHQLEQVSKSKTHLSNSFLDVRIPARGVPQHVEDLCEVPWIRLPPHLGDVSGASCIALDISASGEA